MWRGHVLYLHMLISTTLKAVLARSPRAKGISWSLQNKIAVQQQPLFKLVTCPKTRPNPLSSAVPDLYRSIMWESSLQLSFLKASQVLCISLSMLARIHVRWGASRFQGFSLLLFLIAHIAGLQRATCLLGQQMRLLQLPSVRRNLVLEDQSMR